MKRSIHIDFDIDGCKYTEEKVTGIQRITRQVTIVSYKGKVEKAQKMRWKKEREESPLESEV